MSKKDRKQVMDDFKELNSVPSQVNPAQQSGDKQQVKVTLHEAVQMFGAQLDGLKNNLIGIIMKQDAEIKRLTEELQKKKV